MAGQQAIQRRDYAAALASSEEASRLDTAFVAARMGILEALETTGRYARADTLIGQLEARRATLSPLEQAQLDEYTSSIRGDIGGNLAAAFRMHALAPGGQYRATLATKLMYANRLREALDTLEAANAEVGDLREVDVGADAAHAHPAPPGRARARARRGAHPAQALPR